MTRGAPTPIDEIFDEVRAERRRLSELVTKGDPRALSEVQRLTMQVDHRCNLVGSLGARGELLQVIALTLMMIRAIDLREVTEWPTPN